MTSTDSFKLKKLVVLDEREERGFLVVLNQDMKDFFPSSIWLPYEKLLIEDMDAFYRYMQYKPKHKESMSRFYKSIAGKKYTVLKADVKRSYLVRTEENKLVWMDKDVLVFRDREALNTYKGMKASRRLEQKERYKFFTHALYEPLTEKQIESKFQTYVKRGVRVHDDSTAQRRKQTVNRLKKAAQDAQDADARLSLMMDEEEKE